MRVQLPHSVLPSTEDGLFGTMATKEFALLNPYEACYFYKINEEKDLAYVRYQPLKGARKHPQMTSSNLATARKHYEKVQKLIASKNVKYLPTNGGTALINISSKLSHWG